MTAMLNNTGERMIPELHKGHNKYGAHIARYQASLGLVSGKAVLDIACGTGYGTRLMADKAKKVVGIDISNDSIKYAIENYSAKNIEFKVGDCTDIPLDNATVDVVVSFETLEHLADYKKFMAEIKRVLKPGGALLLSTPNKTESAGGNPFHFKEFSYSEITKLIEAYFKYHKDYFQSLWLYNSILSRELQTSEWQQPVHSINTVESDSVKCEFFLFLCSEKKISEKLEPLGVLSQHFRQHESPEIIIAKLQNQVSSFKKKSNKLEVQNEHLAGKVAKAEKQIADIINSKAWKIARSLQRGSSVAGKFRKLRRQKPIIHFVYLERKQFYGSSIMRVQQLAEIAKKYTTGQEIMASALDTNVRNSILVLTKWALEGLNEYSLEQLRKNNNLLIFDPVDAFLPDGKAQYASIIVAASRTAFEDYKASFTEKKIMLVDHHVDPRLKNLDWSKRPSELRIGYFGELVNTFSTPTIEKRMDFVQVATNRQEEEWLKRLPDYNMHYAIRQVKQVDYHKPFLKGFTAAHCDSNILIQDSQKEAVLWLGKDYPYLLKGKVTERKVLEKLDCVKESFGSAEWKRALGVMKDIKEKTSDEAIGRQLQDLFSEIKKV